MSTRTNMATHKLLVKHCGEVVQVTRNKQRVLRGREMQQVALLEATEDDGYSIVVDENGTICCIDKDSVVENAYADASFTTVIDAKGRCVMPGLVDAHTHPVWAGDRVGEFAMKLAGATYMEIHNTGGGIHSTVNSTRNASEEELLELFLQRLDLMKRKGTTLVECKSGYGLDTENEIKMLKVIEAARRIAHIDVSSTFCGAHAVPRGMSSSEAATDVITKQLPTITDLMRSDQLHVDNIDVFCEKGVFDVQQSRDILLAGKEAGLQINFHAEELHCSHSAEMGAEIGALALSHLEEVSDEGIDAMAREGCIGVLLPTTAYILRLPHPPARAMIDKGVAVALGSDFNPNAYCISMPMVMHLACVNLRMTMPEALCACTINAAAALGKSKSHGSVEVGKLANLLILDVSRQVLAKVTEIDNALSLCGCANFAHCRQDGFCESIYQVCMGDGRYIFPTTNVIFIPPWEHLIYQFGCDVIRHVIWHGDIAHSNE